MGSSCSKKSASEVHPPVRIQSQTSHRSGSIESSGTKLGALKKKMSVNYSKIPNKIHRQETEHQAGNYLEKELFGLVGLNNLGNTCFMNSALQCLSNVPPLCDYFLSGLQNTEINKESFLGSYGQVTDSFAILLKEMWETQKQSLSPSSLIKIITQYGPQFADGSQQDSQEFLVFLLDILHEDLNRVRSKHIIEGKDYNENDYENYAKESWKQYLMRNQSIIVDLFQGQTKSTLQCCICATQSHKFETFMYLSVPIPGKKQKGSSKQPLKFSLQECIEEFQKEEKLDEGERWFCPKCKKPVESTKKIGLWKCPNILIIHIKRFKFSMKNLEKIDHIIDFPLKDFDLKGISIGKQRDRPIYDLFAVSNHKGSLNSGHYTTFAKNRANQNWYFFNDSQVSHLKNVEQEMKNGSPYMLFYSKTSVDEFYRQSLEHPESWPHFFPVDEEKINFAEKSTFDEAQSCNQKTSIRRKIVKQHTYQFFSNINLEKKESGEIPVNNNFSQPKYLKKYDSSVASFQANSNRLQKSKIQNSNQFEMIHQVNECDEQVNGNLDDSSSDQHYIYPLKKFTTEIPQDQSQRQQPDQSVSISSKQQFLGNKLREKQSINNFF